MTIWMQQQNKIQEIPKELIGIQRHVRRCMGNRIIGREAKGEARGKIEGKIEIVLKMLCKRV
jgi:hypothetical protein